MKSVYIDRTGDWVESENDTGEFYLRSEVDKTIAELKEEVDNLLMQNKELCQALQVMYSAEEYTKLQNKNAELKQKLRDHCIHCPVKEQEEDVVADLKQKLENVQASMYADVVDTNMENRRLRRALWLARAKRAEARKEYWYVRSIHEGDKNLWSIDGSAVKYLGCIKRVNFDWLKIWSEVECKCLKKAEEYK